MAGHSKFKNIMYRKGAQDKKRSALFSKLSREITVAAKMGLPDPEANARLRAAVIAARAQSMPKDNIQRAIDKASGGDAENYEELRYEGFEARPAGIRAMSWQATTLAGDDNVATALQPIAAGETVSVKTTGGIVEKEASIHISNVAHIDPETKKPTRVGTHLRTVKDKTIRVRVCRNADCGQEIDK